jgi:hypothetical protein
VILAWLILALSMAMVFFYFQATCQRILRRQFDREYFLSIARVIRLEFPSLRKSLDSGAPVDYSRLPKAIEADFLALTYLLENSAGLNRRHCLEIRLLTLYFRCQLLSFGVRRSLNVGEKRAVLRLTAVLQYFANLVGWHVHTVGFADLRAEGLVKL